MTAFQLWQLRKTYGDGEYRVAIAEHFETHETLEDILDHVAYMEHIYAD